MSKYPQTAQSCLENFRTYFETNSSLSPRTIEFYYEQQHAIIEILGANKRETLPYKISEADIRWLVYDYFDRASFAINTRKNYLASLRVLTEFYQNFVIDDMHIRWPHDDRPKVDWITQDQAMQLLAHPKTPMQELAVNLELCLGFRKCEILRLKQNQIHNGYIEILGKGSMGGKWRNMPFHRDTAAVLQRYNQYRRELVAEARKRRPTVKVPDELVIRKDQSGHLLPFDADGWGWDKKIIIPLRNELGFHFSNHTLRRTFGRTMYRAGVSVVTISKMYGHESIDVTLKYIGVDMDDMTAAMDRSPF